MFNFSNSRLGALQNGICAMPAGVASFNHTFYHPKPLVTQGAKKPEKQLTSAIAQKVINTV
ncbi:hypothetical protein C7N43_04860 [Sphingobacteriales bacterium UPWRP_1]|nr:hypothetical protein BVG80_06785 [Sphingobacteriales bacterium TSM_CSM]PSJ78153.1 hypothetical protein C7N43_04860 [Sphingobacteriales bacterium UPWRP_1]